MSVKVSSRWDWGYLSDACILGLVKTLSTSKTLDTMKLKEGLCNLKGTEKQWKQTHGEQKKQVRRRCQTRRPYKEKLLNMAEIRKEIVTALKMHRASMKEASELQQRKQALRLLCELGPRFETEERIKSRRNPRIYPGMRCSYNCPCYCLENPFNFSHVASPNAVSWSSYPIAPSPIAENPNIELPVQTLGLNLNLHDFDRMDTSVFCHDSCSFFSPSSLSQSSYACPTVSYATHQEVPDSITLSDQEAKLTASSVFCSNVANGECGKYLQEAVNEEETAKSRSIREQHQKAMETSEEQDMKAVESDGHHTFDKFMEFQDWLSIDDNCLQQHLNYQCSEDYFQDPDLSRMGIGELEDMDGEA